MASLGTASLSLRTPEQVQQDLVYLQEHRVCETLELIVKGLLRDQPEDPVLSICNMLRNSNRGSPGHGGENTAPTGGAAHLAMDETAMQRSAPARISLSAVITPVTNPSGGQRAFPTTKSEGGTFRPAVSGSSRADTPAGGSIPAARWNDTQSSAKLERDESSRSDGSVFSISSIDMSEFLSEFRAAHLSIFGEQGHSGGNGSGFITMQDLGDIVDRIVIPLPDVKLLVDLFNELQEAPEGEVYGAEHPSTVAFDAFLARMNFKIQGRYPIEVVRTAFFTLLPADVAALARPQSAVGGRERGMAANGSVGSNLDAFLMGSSGADFGRDTNTDAAVTQLLQSTPSVAATAERISQVALWYGLGLRHDLGTLEGLLAPFRRGSEYSLFFTDFAKVVQALCAGQGQR